MESPCISNIKRFKYCLKNALDTEIDDGFVCTWQDIEDSMIQAVGKENQVNRLHAFNKMKSSDFHSKPLELLIADIDNKIDAVLGNSTSYHQDTKGRMISPYSHFTYLKYNFILGVTENLDGDFSQVKDFIEQEISDMHDNYKTLVDIQTFQEKLVSEFNTRNLIKIFRTKDVPQPKKQSNVNNIDIKEKKKETSPFKEDFQKKKMGFLKDWEIAKELADSFMKFSNESNKDLPIMQDPEVTSTLKEKKRRICGECFSSNCQLLQHLSKVHKTTPRFAGRCKGKIVTMGDIPEVIKNVEKRISYLKKQKRNPSQRF